MGQGRAGQGRAGQGRTPREWWLPCMECFLRKHNLLGLISLGTVATWVREGKRAHGGSSGVVAPSD